jgi:hypothetical protein
MAGTEISRAVTHRLRCAGRLSPRMFGVCHAGREVALAILSFLLTARILLNAPTLRGR